MITIDLINENSVEIGASYTVAYQLCNAPDLTQYAGYCQIRLNNTSTDIILTPIVNILSKDTFSIKIPYSAYTTATAPGNYQYDVLFSKNDNSDRFYAVGGKISLVRRITKI